MRKVFFYILAFSFPLFAYELKDNAVIFTNELNKVSDADFVLGIKKLEALENRHSWGEAYYFAKNLSASAYATNHIESGESWALVLNTISLCYKFENNFEDGTILEEIDEALIQFKEQAEGRCFPFYSKLYDLKMAYYWRRGDTFNHDECLHERFSCDPSDSDTLMTVMACYRERPANWRDSDDLISKFFNKHTSNSPLFQTASIFMSKLPDHQKWEKGLKWLESNVMANEDELGEHLKFMASYLDINKPERTVEYCQSLIAFLSRQIDDISRAKAITLALNEFYRVSSLIWS